MTALAFLLGSSLAQAEFVVEVEQGGVARWGDDCQQCAFNGKTYSPVDGVCYYPIDMEQPADHYQAAKWCSGSLETGWLIVQEKACKQEAIDFPDDSYVHLSAENLARHHGEQAQVKPVFWRSGGEAQFSLSLGEPITPLPGSNNFSVCRTFNGEPKSRHTGTDYAVTGNVQAVEAGVVVLVGEHFFSGQSVYIDHGAGLVTMYFHLSDISVSEGQDVGRGDILGRVGETGRATGPHLHFGIRWYGQRIDPDHLLGLAGSLPTFEDR